MALRLWNIKSGKKTSPEEKKLLWDAENKEDHQL
jgi:hypothetical protein